MPAVHPIAAATPAIHERTVHLSATIDLGAGTPAEIVLRLAAARVAGEVEIVSESLTLDAQHLESELQPDGSVLTVFATVGAPGRLCYQASVTRRDAPTSGPLTLADRLAFTTPSRYCPSDLTAGLAGSLFGAVSGSRAIDDVTGWVNQHLTYRWGTSQVTTTAIETLAGAAGVCRDYAHLTICLLRGLGVPARYVAVYAHDLEPQDFHALVEAHDGGRWRLVDATGLTRPDDSIVIATGRDSADTPFLTVLSGLAPVLWIEVQASMASPPEAGQVR